MLQDKHFENEDAFCPAPETKIRKSSGVFDQTNGVSRIWRGRWHV